MSRPAATTSARNFETIAEAAARYHVSPRTIRRRIAAGDLPAYRVGPTLIRLDPTEVDAALRLIPAAGRRVDPAAGVPR